MDLVQTTHNEYIKNFGFFSMLTPKEQQLVFANNLYIQYRAGEMIFKQGTPASHIIILTEGMAKILIEGYDNKELILAISKATRFLNGPGFYGSGKFDYSGVALTNVTALFVDGIAFKKALSENGKLAEGFITEICIRSSNTLRNFVNLTQQKMPGRMAGAVLYLAQLHASNSFNLILSKKEIGDLTGMTKESATRILNDFIADNIIELNNGILNIINDKKLKDISMHG